MATDTVLFAVLTACTCAYDGTVYSPIQDVVEPRLRGASVALYFCKVSLRRCVRPGDRWAPLACMATIALHAAGAMVMADETELGRVLGNLFENARRYGRQPDHPVAEVEITQTCSGPWLTVSVRDHGPGVPPQKLAQLTTPFFRGDTARTAATGAGLGLAIAEKAVQRMGGSFEITNAPGGGLAANLRLRRAPPGTAA